MALFGDFVLSNRDQILRSWVTAVARHPNISASDNLTYTQLLDHLPELCAELATLLKRPDAQATKRDAKHDARAHGWKRWRQGYKLDELIREICIVRSDLVDNWLRTFAAADADFDIEAQNAARRIVDAFFDNVIVEATGQFVQEHDEILAKANAGRKRARKASVIRRTEFIRLVSHEMREPLGPLLFALEVLAHEESLSAVGLEMILALKGGIEREARAIEKLLSFIEVWSPGPDDQGST